MSSVHLSAFPPVTQVITSANENMITIHTFKIYYRTGFCCPIGSDQGLLFLLKNTNCELSILLLKIKYHFCANVNFNSESYTPISLIKLQQSSNIEYIFVI